MNTYRLLAIILVFSLTNANFQKASAVTPPFQYHFHSSRTAWKASARLYWHCTHVLHALQAIIHVVDTVLLASKDSLNANAVDLSAPAPAPMPMPAAQLAAKPGAAPAKPMSG